MDIYSEFKIHFNKAKQRAKKKQIEFTITLEHLKEIWDKQKGICPISGYKMFQRKNCNTRVKIDFLPERASLDRIDSSKGYIVGNVRFICLIAQYAKHKFPDKDVIKFCRHVMKKHGKSRFGNGRENI